MKTILAFVGGAALAGTIAFMALHKSEERAEGPDQPQTIAKAVPVVDQTPQSEVAPAAIQPQPTPQPRRVSVEPRVARPKPSVTRPEVTVARNDPPPAVVDRPPAPQTESTPTPQQQPAEPVSAPPPVKAQPPKPPEPNKVTIAAGTVVPVRLLQTISSDNAQIGQTFQATLDSPLTVDGFVIAERGSKVEGKVMDAEQAGRVKGLSHLSLELTRLTTSDGQRVAISTQAWEKEGEASKKSDATKVAAGAGIGAALGAIFGGGKGAAIGGASGGAAGGGVVLATRGKPVVLSSETRISFRIKSPVTIVEKN